MIQKISLPLNLGGIDMRKGSSQTNIDKTLEILIVVIGAISAAYVYYIVIMSIYDMSTSLREIKNTLKEMSTTYSTNVSREKKIQKVRVSNR